MGRAWGNSGLVVAVGVVAAGGVVFVVLGLAQRCVPELQCDCSAARG